ncbi:MAG: hypothetical protein ACYS0I_02245 [Planctomycetota bacterium]|jgi:hypothetical protein
MKQIYKEPNLYYIIVPIVVALWPLFVWGVYLPRAEKKLQDYKSQSNKAEAIIEEILKLDRDRLQFTGPKTDAEEFDYGDAIDKVATSCGISSTKYEFSSKPIRASGGRKSQSCHVELKEIDITKVAKFLSTFQLRWANLQCEKVALTKSKGLPDSWKVDLDFKYYY